MRRSNSFEAPAAGSPRRPVSGAFTVVPPGPPQLEVVFQPAAPGGAVHYGAGVYGAAAPAGVNQATRFGPSPITPVVQPPPVLARHCARYRPGTWLAGYCLDCGSHQTQH